jgi:hypothetical protein
MHEKYFKPPFSLPYGHTKVFTSDSQMAFDFVSKTFEPTACEISNEDKQKLLDILNGSDTVYTTKLDFAYKNGTITLNGNPFVWIRSWGRLTGTGGGLGLSVNEATEIQNSFGNYIIEKWSSAYVES